jgi:alkylation response protein AidB-like acyl-CoA dehydrogenase
VTTGADDILETSREIADTLLFPSANDVDRAELLPVSRLDALAQAGFYGLVGPPDAGGLGVDFPTICGVIETIAGGCLTTAFVWIQHHSPVAALTAAAPGPLRDEWLPALCAGRLRAGIALGGLYPAPRHLRAQPADGGWIFNGTVPWVSGWGRIDAVFTAARTEDDVVVRALVDAAASHTLRAQPLALVGANASGTVRLTFDRHFVPAGRVVSTESWTPPPPYDGGGRFNGSLALGVAGRCCRLIGRGPLDAELTARRGQLDAATDETMAEARAAACELAVRAASSLAVATGSGSLLPDAHAQRLYREAMFLLVFGSRPAIRAALLTRLGATAPGQPAT